MTLAEFFDGIRAGRLVALRCAGCGGLAVPPKVACAACGAERWESVPVSPEGTVVSYTVIRVAPERLAAHAPYAVAIVRLRDGLSLMGRVVGVPAEAVKVGHAVRLTPLVEDGQVVIAFGPA